MEWKKYPKNEERKIERESERERERYMIIKKEWEAPEGVGTIWRIFFGVGGWDRDSLYSSGYPGTHSEDQAGLQLRNPPAYASQVLRLKVCTTAA